MGCKWETFKRGKWSFVVYISSIWEKTRTDNGDKNMEHGERNLEDTKYDWVEVCGNTIGTVYRDRSNGPSWDLNWWYFDGNGGKNYCNNN